MAFGDLELARQVRSIHHLNLPVLSLQRALKQQELVPEQGEAQARQRPAQAPSQIVALVHAEVQALPAQVASARQALVAALPHLGPLLSGAAQWRLGLAVLVVSQVSRSARVPGKLSAHLRVRRRMGE